MSGPLRVAVIYPDLLGTYGDGGNGLILARRAEWRGRAAELLQATSDRPLPDADVYCLGGGEDGPQVRAARTLVDDGTLARRVAEGAVVLAVCAGFQVVGQSFPGADGDAHEGVGLLDVTTVKVADPRAVGEVVADAVGLDGLPVLTGFENHGGRTTLGEGVVPLGRVTAGVGNGDGSEGAVSGRVVGTYLHGPVLARNPALADRLLSWALGDVTLPPLDDTAAQSLRTERLDAAGGRRRFRRRAVGRDRAHAAQRHLARLLGILARPGLRPGRPGAVRAHHHHPVRHRVVPAGRLRAVAVRTGRGAQGREPARRRRSATSSGSCWPGSGWPWPI